MDAETPTIAQLLERAASDLSDAQWLVQTGRVQLHGELVYLLDRAASIAATLADATADVASE